MSGEDERWDHPVDVDSEAAANWTRAMKAESRVEHLEAALQRLLFWNEGIEAGRGNHHPHDHIKVIRDALQSL